MLEASINTETHVYNSDRSIKGSQHSSRTHRQCNSNSTGLLVLPPATTTSAMSSQEVPIVSGIIIPAMELLFLVVEQIMRRTGAVLTAMSSI